MSKRFVFRKDSGESDAPWALRDLKCDTKGNHDFSELWWADDCTGECNVYDDGLNAIKWLSVKLREAR